ncbi:MAG: hypothetical protein SGI88_18270 [Candidatus Hydrogenedentes bacterium]|nr:hypothetical protein [Candidatus Hydrogenedentota bacterium]
MDMLEPAVFMFFVVFLPGLILGVILATILGLGLIWAIWKGKSWEIDEDATRQRTYFSTPEHLRSFIGRFIWIYTGKGFVSLNSDSLGLDVDNMICTIPFNSIVRVEMGHYSRLAKPITLKYIEVTYSSVDGEKTILLTPAKSWTAPVWWTNKLVDSWAGRLRQAVEV